MLHSRRLSFLLAMLAAVSCGPDAWGQDLKLATDGKTSYVIVTPEKPIPEVETAAGWLAATLKQMTGADFPIKTEAAGDLPKTVLLIGDTAAARANGVEAAKLRSEEWRVKSVGESLILAGGWPRGTIYAVCEFLEVPCGVLRLDPFFASVPSRKTLTLKSLDRSGRPAFPLRMLFTGFPYGYPAGGGPLIEPYRYANKNNIDGRTSSGDRARMIPDGVHTFGAFISSKEFAATHPEYFGMDASGKRVTDDLGTPSAWTQLCVTNADVRRITLERARKFILDDRAAATKEGREPSRLLSLSQNDNTVNLCLCPQCKAVADREGSESGPLLEYVNHIARGLKDEFPDVLVQTEAYNFSLAAPKTLTPEANVVVRFCDNYGFSDPTHPLAHPRNARPMKLLAGWQAKQCKLGIWDYWRTFGQHPAGFFAPSTNVRALREDLLMFHRSGFELMTIEIEDVFGAGINNDPVSADLQSFMPLRTWIGLKLMDDPNRDLNELLGTFLNGYYGPAAKPMGALLTRMEDRQAKLATRVVDVQRHVWAEEFCDADFFADAYRWLDEAMRATDADAERNRVAPQLGSEPTTVPSTLQTHVQRERIVIDSAYLWLEEHVRRRDPAGARSLPKRADVLKRHRSDWHTYIATVFDADGQKLALPILDAGIDLAEKLSPEETAFEHVAVAVKESDIKLDGKLIEPFWKKAVPARLLPRDAKLPFNDPTSIRLAWTEEALYVGVEQPAEQAFATLGFTVMGADRQGIQLALYAPKANGPQTLNAYFYRYDANGSMEVVAGRKAQSQSVGTITDKKVTTELKFLWSDIDAAVKPNAAGVAQRDFVFNIEAYPQADSKAATHVSSPWLIGTQPSWHSGYYKALRLAKE